MFKHLYCYPHNKWHFIRTSSQAFSTCTCISSVTELSLSPHLQVFVKISFLIPNIMKNNLIQKLVAFKFFSKFHLFPSYSTDDLFIVISSNFDTRTGKQWNVEHLFNGVRSLCENSLI